MVANEERQSGLCAATGHVGTAALGCPVERSSAVIDPGNNDGIGLTNCCPTPNIVIRSETQTSELTCSIPPKRPAALSAAGQRRQRLARTLLRGATTHNVRKSLRDGTPRKYNGEPSSDLHETSP